MKVKVGFNRHFKDANESRHRYRVMKGSAGSGKSVNVAQDYILKLSDKKFQGANLLVVRKVDVSNRNSTFAELRGAIYRIFGQHADRYWRVNESTMSMKCVITGNEIIFRGVQHEKDREKLKSINFSQGKLTWIWVEEATELHEGDIDILDDRLRGILSNPNLYYQITLTFNPVSSMHWIKGKFFDVQHPDVFTHNSIYLNNRFIDEAYHRRMLMRKERDPDGYRIYGLGEWGEVGGLILPHFKVHEFDTDLSRFDSSNHGQDFGFNHANAILTLGFKDGELYICDEIYVHEKDTTEIIEMADEKELSKQLVMWCDSAEPDRIKMWKRAGYRAKGVKKGPGSVKAQIDRLKQMNIHIHPRCVNTIKEMQQWKWKKDEKLNMYTDEPVDVFDDAMAALRYGIQSQMRPGVGVLK